MWIAHTHGGLRRYILFMGSLLLGAWIGTFVSSWIAIGFCVVALMYFICLMHHLCIYGFYLRRARSIIDGKAVEVRDYIHLFRPSESFRYIVLPENNIVYSRVYRNDGERWAIFDEIRQTLTGLPTSAMQHALVLGGGGGSLAWSLTAMFPSLSVDIVEKSKAMMSIARKYFNFFPQRENRIFWHNRDALSFIQDTDTLYDLVIVDIFVGAGVPANFRTKKFASLLQPHLNKNGIIIVNMGSFRQPYIDRFIRSWQDIYPYLDVCIWDKNMVMILCKGRLKEYLHTVGSRIIHGH